MLRFRGPTFDRAPHRQTEQRHRRWQWEARYVLSGISPEQVWIRENNLWLLRNHQIKVRRCFGSDLAIHDLWICDCAQIIWKITVSWKFEVAIIKRVRIRRSYWQFTYVGSSLLLSIYHMTLLYLKLLLSHNIKIEPWFCWTLSITTLPNPRGYC